MEGKSRKGKERSVKKDAGRKAKKKGMAGAINRAAGLGAALPLDIVSERKDQIGGILKKSLDLAETGLTFGIQLFSRLTRVVQNQTSEPGGYPAGEPGYAYPAPGAEPTDWVGAPAPATEPQASAQTAIANRLPLAPGDPVSISFSINNDSASVPRTLSVSVEGFTGEAYRFQLQPGAFSVKPGRRTIGPLDFDKFVLLGRLPDDTPPDTYWGAIAVSGEESFRIPASLRVTGKSES